MKELQNSTHNQGKNESIETGAKMTEIRIADKNMKIVITNMIINLK